MFMALCNAALLLAQVLAQAPPAGTASLRIGECTLQNAHASGVVNSSCAVVSEHSALLEARVAHLEEEQLNASLRILTTVEHSALLEAKVARLEEELAANAATIEQLNASLRILTTASSPSFSYPVAIRVTESMLSVTKEDRVTVDISTDPATGGAIVSVASLDTGCSPHNTLVAIRDGRQRWERLRYTQVFRGNAACWSVFGKANWDHMTALNVSAGDSFSSSNAFEAIGDPHLDADRCDNECSTNFWHPCAGMEQSTEATVELRRDLEDECVDCAGPSTYTACANTAQYTFKDIFVYAPMS